MYGVALLTFIAAAALIWSVARLIHGRRQWDEEVRDLEGEASLLIADDEAGSLTAWLKRFLPAALLASYGERLLWAGRPLGLNATQFATFKIAAALVLPALVPVALLFRLDSITLMLLPFLALAGFLLPDVWLNGQVAQRSRQASSELPLFVDLTATAVSAGLPLTEAVRRVAQDSTGFLAREFLRAVQEMAAGKPRMTAWRDLMDRLPGDDCRSVITAIMQAEQYGTSVAEMLHYQVQQIRTLKQQAAQQTAQAVTVKMRVPMLLLILAPFMLLLLAPALLQVAALLL